MALAEKMMIEGFAGATPKRPSTGAKSGQSSPRRRILSARTRIPGVDYVPFPYVELYKFHGKSPQTPRKQSIPSSEQSMASLLHRMAKSVKDSENTYVPVKDGTALAGVKKSVRKLSQQQLPLSEELCVKSIPLGTPGSERTNQLSPDSTTRKQSNSRADWRLILNRTEKAMGNTPNKPKLNLTNLRAVVRNTFTSPRSLRAHHNSATVVILPGEEDTSPKAQETQEDSRRPIRLMTKLQKQAMRAQQSPRLSANPQDKKPVGITAPAPASRRSTHRAIHKRPQSTVTAVPRGRVDKKDAFCFTDSVDEEDTWMWFQARYIG